MYMKFGRSKIFALFLVLLAAFFVTGTAMAATTLTVGDITGPNVKTANKIDAVGAEWNAEIYYYNTTAALNSSFVVKSVNGANFDNVTSVDLFLDNGWFVDNAARKSVALNSGSFINGTFTLSGSRPVSNTMTLNLQGEDLNNVFSNQVKIALTFVSKDLSLAVSPTTLTPTVGVSFASNNIVTVTALQAGSDDISPFALTTLEVRDSTGVSVTSWNGLSFIADPANKTITVTGIAAAAQSASFSLYATSPNGTIEILKNAFTIDATGSGGQAMVISPDVARFYIGVGRTRTLTIASPSDTFTSLSVSPTSWRGFTIVPDATNKKITVSGTATLVDATSVDVYATNASGDVVTGTFSIVAMEPTGPDKLSTSRIGIWDYGNTAMHASEMFYYNNVGTNTGYNVGGKYDVLFFSSAILDGSSINVYIKDPNDDRFVLIPRMPTSSIPKESWYYVDKTSYPGPYTLSPRGSGSSFGWYRDDINTAANTMTLVVNSQPYVTGDYTFRVEYVYTDEFDESQVNYQDITLRCTEPMGGSSGGGCDAGVGLMALLGFLSVGGFVAVNKRKG